MNSFSIYKDIIKISFQSIKSNLLRSLLTILIIAIGIMALVGILTAIDTLKKSISSEFSMMGANSFAIKSRGMHVHIGDQRYRTRNYTHISYRQAKEFKERFDFPALVAISTYATGNATARYKSKKTNPNIEVWGVDENDIITSGKTIASGRNFSVMDIEQNNNVAIIGEEVKRVLFENDENPLGKVISIGSGKYTVIGILKSKGASMGGGFDRTCLLPVTNVRQYFSLPNRTFWINIQPFEPQLLEPAISEAEGLFRIIRNLDTKDESDFNIEKSDMLAKMLID